MSEYQVLYTSECRQKLESLAPPEPLNEGLAIVLNDLGNNPFAFDLVEIVDDEGKKTRIRFIKTDLFVSETGVVPPLILFFGINESRKQVYIVDVEKRSGFGLNPD